MAWGLALLISLAVPAPGPRADEVTVDGASCLDRLAAFATEQGIAFDPARVTFSARWAGAGHEVQRLPGLRARIPVDRCGAALAVDLTEDCRIVKSQGEHACKRAFPPTFY